MAYVKADAVLNDLPIDEPSVTREEAQAIIDRWVGLVEEAGGTDETATGRHIVEIGASAEVLRKAILRSGYTDTEGPDKQLDRADKLLKTYDASRTATGQPEGARPAATVRNLTPGPLWSGEGFGPWHETEGGYR